MAVPSRGYQDAGGLLHHIPRGAFLESLLLILLFSSAAGAQTIKHITTDSAMYYPTQNARIKVHVHNTTGLPIDGRLELSIRHLADVVHRDSIPLSLSSGGIVLLPFDWKVPTERLKGYGIDADIYSGDTVVLRYSGALDVSDRWYNAPRYGFLTDAFSWESAEESNRILDELNKFHINIVQFQDWQYKHDDVLKEEDGVYSEFYQDFSTRWLSLSVLKNKIRAANQRNMWTMAYDLLYGELKPIGAPSAYPQDGVYLDAAATIPDTHDLSGWGVQIYVMNAGDTDWRSRIYPEFKEAIREVGFRGIQLDQLGTWGGRWDAFGNVLDYSTHYRDFIDGAKAAIREVDPEGAVAFNSVDVGQLWSNAQSNTDILYDETWGPWTYNDLRTRIRLIQQNAPGKQIVLPAYINYNENDTLVASNLPIDSPSALLANAAIYANGAFHLEMGESNVMLTQVYYPYHEPKMSDSLKGKMYAYYDFIVRYENLLFDGATDVTTDAVTWTNLAEGLTTTGEVGKVWSIVKTRPNEIMIHLINLVGINNDVWRDTMPSAPTVKTNFDLKYYTNSQVENVFITSPDTDLCRMTELPGWSTGTDEPYGHYVYMTIPRLEYWNMVVIRTGTDYPASSFASSYRTYIPWYMPIMDGSVDYFYGVVAAADEENGTNGQANSPMDLKNLYMSHDTDFIYMCYTINKDVSTQNDSWGKYIVSFDTDGRDNCGSESSSWDRAVSFGNPHRPDYQINAWMNFPPFDVTDLQRWKYTGGAWTNVGIIDAIALDTTAAMTTIEYKIDKNDLGDVASAKLWLELWTTGGTITDNAQDSVNNPRDDANPGNWTTSTPLKLSTFCHFVPPRIGGVKVENVSFDLKVSWNPCEGQGFRRYDIFRSKTPFHDVTVLSPIARRYFATDSTYLDTDVVVGDTYYYAVVGVNTLGDSDTLVDRWEAERGIIGKGAAVDLDHPGYSGDGFLDQLDAEEANDWSQHTVNVGTGGFRTLKFRYSAGGAGTFGRLDINDLEVNNPILNQTADWNTWATKEQSAYLNAGDNKVKFGYEGANPAFNYDYFEMDNPSGHVPTQVVINEILPDSLNDSTGADADEWVELYNASDTPIDISGWHITNYSGKIFTLPSNLVMPARSWVVAHIDTGPDDLDFADSVAHVYARRIPPDDMFASSDQCGLYNTQWKIVDFVAFGSLTDASADSDAVAAGIWTDNQTFIYAEGTDKSLYLFPDGLDTNSPDNWRATAQGGRASEGGTNDGMDVFDESIVSLDFMLPDWSGILPADSTVTLGDTIAIQMQTDLGNDSEIDYVQVYLRAAQENPIAITLKETTKTSNILRGFATVRAASASATDWIGRPYYGDSISVWDFEGPDRTDVIYIYGARVYIIVRAKPSQDAPDAHIIRRGRARARPERHGG